MESATLSACSAVSRSPLTVCSLWYCGFGSQTAFRSTTLPTFHAPTIRCSREARKAPSPISSKIFCAPFGNDADAVKQRDVKRQ